MSNLLTFQKQILKNVLLESHNNILIMSEGLGLYSHILPQIFSLYLSQDKHLVLVLNATSAEITNFIDFQGSVCSSSSSPTTGTVSSPSTSGSSDNSPSQGTLAPFHKKKKLININSKDYPTFDDRNKIYLKGGVFFTTARLFLFFINFYLSHQ